MKTMHRPTYLFAMIVFMASCKSDSKLLQVKKLANYPSASAIEYFNDHYFIMGDDSRNLLVLNNELDPVDSVSLYSFTEKRMPKATKADIEAVTITAKKQLLLLGSGSLAPYRNGGWLIDPATKRIDTLQLDTLYRRLQLAGLHVLNIEGACSIQDRILLANRGNYGWRNNHLVVLGTTFWKNQDSTAVSLIRLGSNSDSTVFNGISGLAYAPKSDRLLCTVSTEKTYSNTGDGVIGKSYLWIIKDISTKKRWLAINPDMIIDLEELDPGFAGQKIESVCVIKETKNALHLALAADNDDGSSTIFRIIIEY